LGKIQAEINTSFGKIVVEGSTPNEVLEVLKCLPSTFISDLEILISEITSLGKKEKAEKANSMVKYTEEGPILLLSDPKSITHCEAIGLLLYFLENRSGGPSQIRRLLEHSGINIQVSSRLNEMYKRGLVFKSASRKPEWTLSPKGERWVEEEILPKLRKVEKTS
jgi:predicted transcriptional regulator